MKALSTVDSKKPNKIPSGVRQKSRLSPFRTLFGNRLKKLTEKNEWTLLQLADASELSEKTISRWISKEKVLIFVNSKNHLRTGLRKMNVSDNEITPLFDSEHPQQSQGSLPTPSSFQNCIFVERRVLEFGTLAEKNLRLDGEELVAFYRNETPITIILGDRTFILPATLAHKPTDDGKLSAQVLEFSIQSTPFTLDSQLDVYTRSVIREAESDGRLFNGKVTRLSSLMNKKGVLSPAHYFDALATNFAMDFVANSSSLRGRLQGANKKLGDFQDSKLVNHLGIVCIVETADGKLVAQARGSDVANRPASISASVSGASNWTDVYRPDSETSSVPLSALITGALRESIEELGVEPRDIRYLGIVREYLRGGKPELYLYARSSESMDDVVHEYRNAEGRKESNSLSGFDFHSEDVSSSNEKSKIEFQLRVNKILEEYSPSANFTFVAGVLLTARHVLLQKKHA
jgi:transcriptional regulator with XRE-family HTH domain